MSTFKETQAEVHNTAKDHGWWEGVDLNHSDTIPSKLALVHSEISEALEHFRSQKVALSSVFYTESGKPDGFAIEIADAVIRCMDLCGAMGIDLEEMIRIKAEYNKGRPYKHGGKRV